LFKTSTITLYLPHYSPFGNLTGLKNWGWKCVNSTDLSTKCVAQIYLEDNKSVFGVIMLLAWPGHQIYTRCLLAYAYLFGWSQELPDEISRKNAVLDQVDAQAIIQEHVSNLSSSYNLTMKDSAPGKVW